MKYYLFRLEIMDGEHGYYYKGVLQAKTLQSAENKANRQARHWYDDKSEKDNSHGGFPVFYFIYQGVTCQVDELREITKEHYEILKQYL